MILLTLFSISNIMAIMPSLGYTSMNYFTKLHYFYLNTKSFCLILFFFSSFFSKFANDKRIIKYVREIDRKITKLSIIQYN